MMLKLVALFPIVEGTLMLYMYRHLQSSSRRGKWLPKESHKSNHPGCAMGMLNQILVELQTLNPNFVVGMTCKPAIGTSEPFDNEALED